LGNFEAILAVAGFSGPIKAHPIKPMTRINAAATSPVATFLPPVQARIREISGLTASEMSRMRIRDNRMGDRSENVSMKANNAAPDLAMG
jgi:hypothetical protein